VIGLARQQPTPHGIFHLFGLRERVPVMTGPIEESVVLKRTVADHAPDVVFHLASQSQLGAATRDPQPTFETNIRGTWSVLEACRTAPRPPRLLFASSEKVYGSHLSPTEETPLTGTAPYETSKICAELLGQTYVRTYGLALGILRYSNLYGGGDFQLGRIVPSAIHAILNEQRPVIRSDGLAVRDYLYIEDAARACLVVARHLGETVSSGEAFNFSSGRTVSVLELVTLILQLMDRADLLPHVLGEGRDDVPLRALSSQKARQQLGWSALVSLETGLARTIAWYRQHRQFILPR
jgi:CDP-glucose 4,6-dehydratase